jgi:hypothetical protein
MNLKDWIGCKFTIGQKCSVVGYLVWLSCTNVKCLANTSFQLYNWRETSPTRWKVYDSFVFFGAWQSEAQCHRAFRSKPKGPRSKPTHFGLSTSIPCPLTQLIQNCRTPMDAKRFVPQHGAKGDFEEWVSMFIFRI